MAGFTNAMPTTFKQELMQKLHDFTITTGNDFKVALGIASPTGTYGAATTNYTNLTGNSDEVAAGGGYTTGGFDITAAYNTTPLTSGAIAYTTPGNTVTWTSATFSTSGCIIYNATNGNRAVYVGSFGGVQTVAAGTFTILWPVNDSTHALLRLS